MRIMSEKCFSQRKPQRMRAQRVSHLPCCEGHLRRPSRLQSTLFKILFCCNQKNFKFSILYGLNSHFHNTGYFAVADDSILNFWQPFNLDMVFHQRGLKLAATGRGWWNGEVGNCSLKYDYLKWIGPQLWKIIEIENQNYPDNDYKQEWAEVMVSVSLFSNSDFRPTLIIKHD